MNFGYDLNYFSDVSDVFDFSSLSVVPKCSVFSNVSAFPVLDCFTDESGVLMHLMQFLLCLLFMLLLWLILSLVLM